MLNILLDQSTKRVNFHKRNNNVYSEVISLTTIYFVIFVVYSRKESVDPWCAPHRVWKHGYMRVTKKTTS